MSIFYVYGPNRSQPFYHHEFRSLTEGSGAKHVFVDYKKFPDGELDMTVPQLHSMTNARVVYFANWSNPQFRYADWACLLAISEMKPQFLTIVIPFSPTGTMEREEHEGSICTANVDAKLLSSLPCSQKRVIVIDLHTVTNQFYFYNTAVTNESCMPYVVKNILPPATVIGNLPPPPVIAFPDAGAQKRFHQYFEKYAMVACSKVRGENDKRVVVLAQEDHSLVKGKTVWVFDDLVRSGNTLIECARVLRAAGAVEICAFVPHAVFPRDEFVNITASGLFNRFIVTDSVPETTAKLQTSPFEVISLAKILVSIVKP